MELVSFAKEVVQNVAEHAASYRVGQTVLRHLDRALWVVEKCARWAVPPPLDQDDTPQPELVRPLPWVFFLVMLVTLRVTRESISLVNLILGKPPLRSADVVMYIQSKRRYLRTLKYQGNRIIRARSAPKSEPWYSGLQAMFEFTMCFRRSHHYGNNNTTSVSNNDEVLVVKRGKRSREAAPAPATAPAAATSENTMERLIEKMMVDLDADSDDDSSFTLTNATSPKSDHSDYSEAEDNTLHQNDTTNSVISINSDVDSSPMKSDVASLTPEKNTQYNNDESVEETKIETKETDIENGTEKDKDKNKAALSEPVDLCNTETASPKTKADLTQKEKSPKEDSRSFLQNESSSPSPSKHSKFANGRAISVPNKKKGMMNQRRDTAVPVMTVKPADSI